MTHTPAASDGPVVSPGRATETSPAHYVEDKWAHAKPGWHGRFFEDFGVGDVYEHPLGRTVLATDNAWFTLLTQNTAPLHFDRHYAQQTGWQKPLVDSTFTLALVTGQSVTDISQNVFANLAWTDVEIPFPVFEDDTVYSRSRVLSARESQTHPAVGIVQVETEGYNQNGEVVIRFKRIVMVYKRGHGPGLSKPEVKERAR